MHFIFSLWALFFLAAPLLSACSPIKLSSTRAETPDPPKDRAKPTFDPALISLLRGRDAEEREYFYIVALLEEEKAEKRARDKKRAQEAAAKQAEEPPTALQEAPGPAADDTLVDLLQKEFDQAMEQPPERRKIEFSMPVVENDRVRYFVSFFSGRKKDFFERALARSGRYIPMMATILREEGLPEDLVYLSLIESGFSPSAYSRAKAVGPWQFIRATGLRYGLKINWWIDERRDPVKSTRAAAAYLKDLHNLFGEWFLAAAAYNAGERKVEKAMNRSRTNDFWLLSQKTYLKRETRNYVPKFIAAAVIARTPEKHGFGDIVYELPMEYDEVTTKGPLKLETAATMANTTVSAVKELNPALLRGYTPPSKEGFTLRLPSGTGETFARAYEALPQSEKTKFATHRVARGETLQSIAKRYGQKVSQLMVVNSLKTQRLRDGQEITVLFDGVLPAAATRSASRPKKASPAKKSVPAKTTKKSRP
jgi:membrane-bound lytic murein transglycosylase D